MPFKIKNEWIKDKAKLICLACLISLIFFPVLAYLIEKNNKLDLLFFSVIYGYLMVFNGYMLEQIKKEKKKYFLYATLVLVFIEISIIFILFITIHLLHLEYPKYGAFWVIGSISYIMIMSSHIIYETIYSIIKKKLRKKEKSKGVIELNKFQEKAKEKIEDMLKSLGIKYEEFKKVVEGDEILLQSYMEVKGKTFMIEISEDAIALGAEEKEAAFILELIDYESSKKLINDFCERTKETFEIVNQFGKYYSLLRKK